MLFIVVDALLEEQPLIVSGLKILLNEPSLKVRAACNWSRKPTNKATLFVIMVLACVDITLGNFSRWPMEKSASHLDFAPTLILNV